jgi:hypothetical protein
LEFNVSLLCLLNALELLEQHCLILTVQIQNFTQIQGHFERFRQHVGKQTVFVHWWGVCDVLLAVCFGCACCGFSPSLFFSSACFPPIRKKKKRGTTTAMQDLLKKLDSLSDVTQYAESDLLSLWNV